MSENNKQPFKMSVSSMNLMAIAIVIVDTIYENFGTYPHYSGGSYSMMELLGIGIPLLILIVPIFNREYRETCWNKKNTYNNYWYFSNKYIVNHNNICK